MEHIFAPVAEDRNREYFLKNFGSETPWFRVKYILVAVLSEEIDTKTFTRIKTRISESVVGKTTLFFLHAELNTEM